MSRTTATNNLFEYSGPHEFYVYAHPGNTLSFPNQLVGNTFYKNTGDGLDLMMPGSSLKSNEAIDNTGHGMVVVGGANLGGDIAYGNTKNPSASDWSATHRCRLLSLSQLNGEAFRDDSR